MPVAGESVAGVDASQKSPFFIVGVHRSGTTLLRYMLSSHPHIYIPEESDFIPRFFGRDPTETLSDRRIGRILSVIFRRYRFVNEWQGPRPDTRSFIASMSDRSPAALLDTLYSLYAAQYGAVRWGDKTPIYASYISLILRIFPEAQIIHVIRDGRDAALSMLEKYQRNEFHVDIYFAARNWVRRIRQAQASTTKLDNQQYLELRYENLVQHPERELRRICRFLGEQFVPEMLSHHRLASRQISPDSHFFGNVRNPVTATQIARWQKELSPKDQRLVQLVQGRLLEELGYEICNLGRLTGSERVRLTVLQCKYLLLQSGRRVAQALQLVPPI